MSEIVSWQWRPHYHIVENVAAQGANMSYTHGFSIWFSERFRV